MRDEGLLAINVLCAWCACIAHGAVDVCCVQAANHERQGLQAYVDVPHMGKVCYPLLVNVDYCGFRVVVYAAVPITQGTIAYGSNDGGTTVHADDATINTAMRQAATSLHLKGHAVGTGTHSRQLFAAGDVEVHTGEDSRTYLVNTARALPPALGDYHTGSPSPLQVLQLRPELVRQHHTPLCPDAGTTWSLAHAAADLAQVKHATRALEQCVVPRLARALLQDYYDVMERPGTRHSDDPAAHLRHDSSESSASTPSRGESKSTGPSAPPPAAAPGSAGAASTGASAPARADSARQVSGVVPVDHLARLVLLVHRAGVNVRYLGLLRHHVWLVYESLLTSPRETSTPSPAAKGAAATTRSSGGSGRSHSGDVQRGTPTPTPTPSPSPSPPGSQPQQVPTAKDAPCDVGLWVVSRESPDSRTQLAVARVLLRHLLTEMVARVIKVSMKARMRSTLRAPHQSQRRGSIAPDTYVAASDQEELVQVVVRVMNEVFDESQRNKFWVSVRKALTDKFVDGIHQVQCLRSCWSAACVCW